MNSHILDRLSFLSLALTIILLPVFVLPLTNIPVETSKGLILVFGLAVSLVLWAIARFFDGRIVVPKSPLLIAAGVVVLTFFLSAILSPQANVSLFGVMFDLGSFWFIFAGFMLLFMSAMLFRTERQVRLLLFGIVLSSILVIAFQSARLFLPELLSLGLLANKTGNIFGSWNALGLFAGFAALLFLLIVEFFPIPRIGKPLLQVFILLSVLLTAAVNFTLVWMLLGISSLIIFAYKASLSLSKSGETTVETRHFPAISFAVVLLSLLFLTSGQSVRNFLPNFFELSNAEVGPSLQATFQVGKSIVTENPVWGIGPNRFGEAWARYKPIAVNNSAFWDVSFDSGYGILPTLVATTGIVGILSWLLFLTLFLAGGAKSVFNRAKDGASWEIMATFVLSLYLFAAMLFYSAGSVIFLLGLAFAGVFSGLAAAKKNREISWSFLNDHRKSFFSILTLILLIIFSSALSFRYFERFASVAPFRRALETTEIIKAEAAINRAVALNYNDLYLRTYAQVYLVKLNSLVGSDRALSGIEKADAETALGQAVRSAELAVGYNPANYQNFRLLGSVYETAGALGVLDAYNKAFVAFQKASELNPLNPALKLGMARAALADGKRSEALTYAEAALALTPNDSSVTAAVNSIKGRTAVPAAESVLDDAN